MRITALGLALVLAFALGCGRSGHGPTVRDYAAKRAAAAARARHGRPVQPTRVAENKTAKKEETGLGGIKQGEGYNAMGKRDPFRSFVLEQKQENAVSERGPLEQFDLSQLNVVAVVWNTARPRALVVDPSGRSYVIQEGTRIGKNSGRVIHIGDNQVLVRETYVDYLGTRTTKEVHMRIRQSQGG